MLRIMVEYEIAPPSLKSLLVNGSGTHPVLLDVREPWEFATAKIEGSISMPMGDIPSRAHQELDPEVYIVTICHHGMRSLNVALWLRQQGFEQVQSLRGGVDAWSSDVDPTVPRY